MRKRIVFISAICTCLLLIVIHNFSFMSPITVQILASGDGGGARLLTFYENRMVSLYEVDIHYNLEENSGDKKRLIKFARLSSEDCKQVLQNAKAILEGGYGRPEDNSIGEAGSLQLKVDENIIWLDTFQYCKPYKNIISILEPYFFK